jgi:hypothetical protein
MFCSRATHLMIVFVAALALVTVGAGCGGDLTGEGYPDPQDENQRIVGGDLFSGLPAVGALLSYGYLQCTGTVVEPRKVITAAHCVEGTSPSTLSFMFGPSVNSAQSVVQVTDAYAHPDWDSSALANDIGVVILAQDAPVTPMGVVTAMDDTWEGTNLFFVGYGNTSSSGGSGTKRAVWMPITDVEPTIFKYGGGGRNTCNGDSGGPAFYKDANGTFLVAGITSYGDMYCSYFGADTRVDAYLDFLDLAGGSTPPPQNNCNGETDTGRCDGETLIYCENNQVIELDCAASGKVCLPDPQTKFNTCVKPATPPDDPSGPISATCPNCDLSTMDCTGQAGVYTCVPKSDTCTYTNGTLFRQCDCTGWQFCLDDNTWSEDCESRPSIFSCI